MSRLFYHVMQDNAGNLLFGVSGTMRLAGTGTAATIYGDEALTVPIANPMTNHPSFGSFKCFLGVGDYDFYMAKSGYTFETLTGVQGSGTMADQNANNVSITGGNILTITSLGSAALDISGNAQVLGRMAIGNTMALNNAALLKLDFLRGSIHGIMIRPNDSDTVGGAFPIVFVNTAATAVGSIATTAGATAYNTTSDSRLKEAIEPLTGALDLVRALNPVAFRWKVDGSPGRGFLAHEVAEVVDGVITGEKNAVDDEGQIQPQMIDYSKLVPYLIGAVKELTQQVEMLQAQLATVGA